MGNPRNLRRASSEDEEEGDIFDDKSEISSGSDEEENRHPEEAAAGSPASAEDARGSLLSGPPAGTATSVEGGDSSTKVGGREAARETADADTAGDGHDRRATSETVPLRSRRGGARGDGYRMKLKTTWQLMQEDPSFVPRETRYFLHDDRRDGDSEETDDAERGEESQPDTSIPRSVQTRIGSSKKLWTPDENKGVWEHDMWEQLQKEEAEGRTTAYDWNKGRAGRRGGYNGYSRGGRVDNGLPRGSRGSRFGGSNGYSDSSWRGGWRPRGRGRRHAWDNEPRRQYVPRQSAGE